MSSPSQEYREGMGSPCEKAVLVNLNGMAPSTGSEDAPVSVETGSLVILGAPQAVNKSAEKKTAVGKRTFMKAPVYSFGKGSQKYYSVNQHSEPPNLFAKWINFMFFSYPTFKWVQRARRVQSHSGLTSVVTSQMVILFIA
jgi:hypothetical protein